MTRRKMPEYRTWGAMKRRCSNPKDTEYARYGGRGISVCERWAKSFETFLFDMGLKPTPGHSIDRIDNNGNYEPGNCRWATAKQQIRNSRRMVYLTHQGETLCLTDWAARLGLRESTLVSRRHRGLPIHEVLAPEKISCAHYGEGHGRAKLTADQVRHIREITRGHGIDEMKSMAAKYSVSVQNIRQIRDGRNWKCLDSPLLLAAK